MSWENGLRWTGAIGIAAIAVMRCLILFVPRVVFDVDPALDPTPIAGLGPAGSMWLDIALLLFAACGFAGESLSGRGISWLPVLLALIPLPIVLWHGSTNGIDLYRGLTWAAAAIACVAAAHLARDRGLRIVMLMLFAAVIFPLLVRGAANMTYEHDDTLRQWENNKQAFLAEKGWEENSPNTLIYERRMSHREPRGWFNSTNVFGSLAGFSAILMLGLTILSIRAKLTSGWAGAMALAAIASAASLWMTGSMGALLAAFGGLVLLLLTTIGFVRKLLARVGPPLAVLCVLGAIVAVAMRGVVLPEGFANERSLLYRWHYVVSSARIVAEDPLTGVGPGSYQQAYMKHRLPRNPEEVASAHSVFFDWLATLGLAGSAWIVLVLMQTWRAGQALRFEPIEPDAEKEPQVGLRVCLTAVGAVCAFGIVPAMLAERHELWRDALALFLRIIGLVGYALLALAAGHVLSRARDWVLDAAVFAAMLALLVHGQIEMTFTQPGSVAWVMCMLGLAGPVRPGGRKSAGWIGAALATGAALWLAITAAIPATRQQAMMIEAAEMLRPMSPLSENRVEPDSPDAVALRREVAGRLEVAHECWPVYYAPLIAAADQLERAGRHSAAPDNVAALSEARVLLQECIEQTGAARPTNLSFFIELRLAELTGNESHHESALDLARAMTEIDPHGIAPWRRLGDLLWKLERRSEAAEAYERCLTNNANFSLDPLKQLSERDRTEIERRLSETGAQ